MSEAEFIQLIDCRLPYGDSARVRELIELGASISTNASFMVLHEICRPPQGAEAGQAERLNMLAAWAASIEHPLAAVVLPIARSMIQRKAVSVDTAMAAMHDIAPSPGQYNALAIACMACDDLDGQADALYQKIIHAWATAMR